MDPRNPFYEQHEGEYFCGIREDAEFTREEALRCCVLGVWELATQAELYDLLREFTAGIINQPKE